MLYKIQTENGTITLFKEAVAAIIIRVMETFAGKVLIANQKGKIYHFIARVSGKEDGGTIEIVNGKKGFDIRIYVLIRFGSSINKTTELIIEQIKNEVEKGTGVPVNSVSVVITGVFSKQIARRNIEIKKET
ncbi:Asp23/Gls24 family envelope stress response protein [Sinanaerobacter sp. ZZT-01]|uniref:Asp23/Gls24 family envelope stress response protein n=1 Tax=Sinanaerobacter sp. ZZT-01 TaxID=3111540 RepID=UPI002D79C4E5|nr:Asp23/Gls24 family envelope stress response protein [Sinanaerobacter sp. ZZT-01]WRR93058.1 Asp23/Gls24 family envelope stress response protein [Sinanaerobacter sp. ZZT-01]